MESVIKRVLGATIVLVIAALFFLLSEELQRTNFFFVQLVLAVLYFVVFWVAVSEPLLFHVAQKERINANESSGMALRGLLVGYSLLGALSLIIYARVISISAQDSDTNYYVVHVVAFLTMAFFLVFIHFGNARDSRDNIALSEPRQEKARQAFELKMLRPRLDEAVKNGTFGDEGSVIMRRFDTVISSLDRKVSIGKTDILDSYLEKITVLLDKAVEHSGEVDESHIKSIKTALGNLENVLRNL